MLKKLNKVADEMCSMDKDRKSKAPKHQKQDDESLEGVEDTSLEEQQEGESDASINVSQKPKVAKGSKMPPKEVAAIAAKGKAKVK